MRTTPTKTNKEQEGNTNTNRKASKNSISRFFSNMGYSIWMAVMIIGGLFAFAISLLLL